MIRWVRVRSLRYPSWLVFNLRSLYSFDINQVDKPQHPYKLKSWDSEDQTWTLQPVILWVSFLWDNTYWMAYRSLALKYCCDLIRLPTLATSMRLLDRLFVRRERTVMTKTSCLAFIGITLCNQLPHMIFPMLQVGSLWIPSPLKDNLIFSWSLTVM